MEQQLDLFSSADFEEPLHEFTCKGTTNIWNKQGFDEKNRIYLNFKRESLVIRTNVRLYFRRVPFG